MKKKKHLNVLRLESNYNYWYKLFTENNKIYNYWSEFIENNTVVILFLQLLCLFINGGWLLIVGLLFYYLYGVYKEYMYGLFEICLDLKWRTATDVEKKWLTNELQKMQLNWYQILSYRREF